MSEPTAEAIEAAVNAIGWADNPKWDHPIMGYETFTEEQKEYLRDLQRTGLTAAAPYMVREARAAELDAAAAIFHHASSAALTLRARAAAIRDGAE